MEFNPDAYLAQKAPDSFDPDAYLSAKGPETSAAGAIGRGALDAIPFGDKAAAKLQYVANGSDYDKNLSDIDANLAADKTNHPVAHGAGEVVGSVAPFAIPGVGEALGAESLAGRAAIGAGLGGLQGASENRDSSHMVGDIAKGAGMGAIANPIVGGLGDAIGGAARAVTPSMDEFRAQATSGVLGATARQIRTMRGDSPEAAVNKIGDWFSDAKSADGTPLFSYGDHLGDRLAKVQTLHDEAGQAIGSSLKQAGIDSIPAKPLVEQLQSVGKFATPDEKAQTASVIQAITQAADQNGNIPFETLHALKGEIGHAAFPKSGITNQPLSDAYHTISNVQEDALKDIDLPGFQDAKHNYAMSSQAIPMLKMGLGKEIVGGSKVGSMIPAVGMGALVSPAAGAATAAGTIFKPSAERLGKSLMFGAAQGLKNAPSLEGAASTVAPMVTNGLLNSPAMAQFAPHFQNAAQGAKDDSERNKAYSVTDYVLSQSNPAYAKAKADAQAGQ